MCATCGCHEQHEHHHAHAGHDHAPDGHRLIRLEHDVLARNDALAAVNRRRLAERGAVAINLLAAPGAGKTTLLERTIRELRAEIPLVVIEGDQATDADAARIRAAGAPAVQVNTGTGCHLDAAMVARALDELDPPAGAVVLIENVGNLVCPALFDLGEAVKVVVASVPEGDDKPTKYPHMFRAAGLVLLNKIDLAPHVAFDRERWGARVHSVNPGVETLAVSATGGAGLDAWCAWLRGCRATERRPA